MAIRQLPDNLINRIAAGEVIERPASVVKELVENSLDAGAKKIIITTARGGKEILQVEDDGYGIDEKDLPLAVERHATSKLLDDNLDNITSLGFRGEALASISAVATISIASRTNSAKNGFELTVENGKKSKIKPCSMNRGTIIKVENLFAKIPARLKFLKSDRAETNAITDIIKRLAMANPFVHFIIEGSDRKNINWPAQKGEGALRARIAQIMGADFVKNSFSLNFANEKIKIGALASLPTFTRANSLGQFFFVNGRSVRDKILLNATRVAFSDYIFRDRFPLIALFLSIEPDFVDVNVHPAKSEVRFKDAGIIRSSVIKAIREGLEIAGYKTSSKLSDATLTAFQPAKIVKSDNNSDSNNINLQAKRKSHLFSDNPKIEGLNELSAKFDHINRPFETEKNVYEQEVGKEKKEEKEENYPLGIARAQIFANYIIAQNEHAILLIDQHAAHERLTYEKFKQQLKKGAIATQAQLIPIIVELAEEDCERLVKEAAFFEQLGLYIEPFGNGAIAVREVPALFGAKINIELLIKDLADGLAEWGVGEALEKKIEEIIARMACHGSVRSGRILKQEEMNALLREMEQTPHSGQCIHGRPTYIELKKSDIEKLFGRS